MVVYPPHSYNPGEPGTHGSHGRCDKRYIFNKDELTHHPSVMFHYKNVSELIWPFYDVLIIRSV